MEQILTTASIDWATVLADAVRVIEWSPRGRLLAIAANGSALVWSPQQITAPMTPDPRDAVWLGESTLAIVDPVVGLTAAGFSPDRPLPLSRASRVATRDGRTVVGGDGRVAVYGDLVADAAFDVIETGIGVTHACVHVGGTIFAIGGTGGLALVDVALNCVDARLELPGVIAISSSPGEGRLVASDLAGVVHVLELRDLHAGIELTGYCDPVRHLSLSPDGRTVVAAAADELTRWAIDGDGAVADEPTSVVAHAATITALESNPLGFLATGDEHGVVHLWSPLLTDHPVATLHLDSEITALGWNGSGTRLACGAASGELFVVDVVAGTLA